MTCNCGETATLESESAAPVVGDGVALDDPETTADGRRVAEWQGPIGL